MRVGEHESCDYKVPGGDPSKNPVVGFPSMREKKKQRRIRGQILYTPTPENTLLGVGGV